jgi:cobalt-zinc-cadmium efflux system protein
MHNHDHHHQGHDHHGHDHHGHTHRPSSRRALLIGLAVTSGFAVVEAVAGWLAGSLALIGDAGHMITDAAALGLGAVATTLSLRPPTLRHSFGLRRAEILGALANAVFMLLVVGWISIEAVQRMLDPVPVQGPMVLVVAAIGLLVNLAVLKVLHGGEQNLNTRGAALHVLGDLLGSVAALLSGLIITFTGWTIADPILSLLISALILASTWRVLREAVLVVMEGVPAHIDLEAVGQRLAAVEGVTEVHDLHVWAIGSSAYALSAHVRLATFEHWPERLKRMEAMLHDEFGIDHVTLQPEAPYEVVLMPQETLRGTAPPQKPA